ncbi:capreomycidine synthase [Streptomyces cyaneofuscatus]|uniref:capreomycidine synthase n=1 Tax=Streptomyces cyaneofuscatus TaxID=66883 RepID=UPI00380CF375
MALADIAPALLEDWLRTRYFTAKTDISSSGMAPGSLAGLRQQVGLEWSELDALDFRDSPSQGGARLRHALAERFVPGAEDRVMVTNGSSEALFLTLAALIRPDDEVVVTRPAYQSLYSPAVALGARLRFWDLAPEDDFVPDLAALERVLTPRTKLVIVNFPHNPTGATLTPEQYREFTSLISRHGCYLLWDGAFGELTHGQDPLPDPSGEVARCVSTGTLSKSYGLPGLRVGWCFAPAELLPEMIRVRDYLTLNVSPLNETVAAAAVEHADSLLAVQRARAGRGRNALTRWAARHPGLVALPPPHGGVCAFPALRGVPDVTAMADRLAREHGVLVVPGECFGHDDRVRIGFGGDIEELDEGLRVLAEQAGPVR